MNSTIDHVELLVPDRDEAAAWYETVLGLTRVASTARWEADPDGPLMISADNGATKLALFRGDPRPELAPGGWQRVAFRVEAGEFVACLERARRMELREHGKPLRLNDHTIAFSIYFSDPYGHLLEVTCYDHDVVRTALQGTRPGTDV